MDPNLSIAQKLLCRMGWCPGLGLGKHNQGIVEAIQVTKRPIRQGLGFRAPKPPQLTTTTKRGDGNTQGNPGVDFDTIERSPALPTAEANDHKAKIRRERDFVKRVFDHDLRRHKNLLKLKPNPTITTTTITTKTKTKRKRKAQGLKWELRRRVGVVAVLGVVDLTGEVIDLTNEDSSLENPTHHTTQTNPPEQHQTHPPEQHQTNPPEQQGHNSAAEQQRNGPLAPLVCIECDDDDDVIVLD